MRAKRYLQMAAVGAGLLWLLQFTPSAVHAQSAPLRPRLPDLTGVVVDANWARVLGKAFFWDVDAGSDGMACASCHFHAGADVRIKNQLSPGLTNLPDPDLKFGATVGPLGKTASGGTAGPNYELKAADFPFHQPSNKKDRNSPLVITTNDRVASSGAYDAQFTKVKKGKGDRCSDISADVFHAGRFPARQVEPRNTPTMINAAFFARNFWDGRANNVFNGKGVFGWRDIDADPTARVLVHTGGGVQAQVMALPDASLASQAVGPPLSELEMSCAGRTFAEIGRKILAKGDKALGRQRIHPDDSLLGTSGPKGDQRRNNGVGLQDRYQELIQKAFDKKYWGAPGRYIIAPNGTVTAAKGNDGFTQMEHNFSMFWGVAIMLYEATLISDQSKFDTANAAMSEPGCLSRFPVPCSAAPSTVLTDLEKDGHALFTSLGRTGCTGCHSGALFSFAAAPVGAPIQVGTAIRVRQADPAFGPTGTSCTTHDFGFFAIGTRPAAEDLGTGATDPYNNPLSFAAQIRNWVDAGSPTNPAVKNKYIVDRFDPNAVPSFDPTCVAATSRRLKIDSSFKTPGLRNVALTPPYFHYGGYATLEQVIEFYARGGSRRDQAGRHGDDSGTGPLGDERVFPVRGDLGRNADDGVRELNLNIKNDPDPAKGQKYGESALVAFLKTLTDPRVQCDKAPFDHPELSFPHGHEAADSNGDGKADDIMVTLPAVGRNGYSGTTGKYCIPNAGDLFAPGMLTRVGK